MRQVGPGAVHHRGRFDETPVHKRAGDPPTFALDAVDAAPPRTGRPPPSLDARARRRTFPSRPSPRAARARRRRRPPTTPGRLALLHLRRTPARGQRVDGVQVCAPLGAGSYAASVAWCLTPPGRDSATAFASVSGWRAQRARARASGRSRLRGRFHEVDGARHQIGHLAARPEVAVALRGDGRRVGAGRGAA